MSDLSLVPIMELLNELDKRFETIVVLTVKERNGSDIFEFHKKGGHMTALGLCENYAFALKNQKELDETEEFHAD